MFVWLLQRRESPGPVYFSQTRAGMKNRPFTIYKFRTMRVDNPDEARQATAQDDRIFPAGRWLRKVSLDELPQLWNVFVGDMSLVGPRPPLPGEVSMYERRSRRRYSTVVAMNA